MLMELELLWLLAPDFPVGGSWHCLPGNECLHSFLVGGLTLAAWERLPALLSSWGVRGLRQVESPTMFPAWERVPALLPSWGVRGGLAGGVTNYVSCLGKECLPSFPAGGLGGLAGGVTNYVSCLGRVPALFLARGLTLAAKERVPALLPSWEVSRWSHQLCFH